MQVPRARNKIRQWFTKERREEAIEQGKDQIAKLMRKEGLPLKRVLTHETLATVAKELRLADVSALYAAVGEGNVGAQTVVRRVIDLYGGGEGADGGPRRGRPDRHHRAQPPIGRRRRRDRQGPLGHLGQAGTVLHAGARRRDPRVRHARGGCVGPPHRLHQHRGLTTQPERIVEVEWAPTGQSLFLVDIQVEALDRARLLSDITRCCPTCT